MMDKEIVFNKYKLQGADYHYQQINRLNIRKFNAFLEARYLKLIQIIKIYLKTHHLKKTNNINVLDIGCGDGVLLYLLKKKLSDYNFNIFGLDSSEEALKTAKEKIPEGNFINSSVYDLSLLENTFDLIISSDVIEHLQEPKKMLSEINQVATVNSIIIIGTPIKYTEKPLDKMHVHEFFQNEFIDLIKTHLKLKALIESHKQIYYLKYIKQSKLLGIRLNRYMYNFMSFLGKNVFLEKIENPYQFPTYMFAICSKNI